MIYNKSNHPVEVKKISVRIWTLRDEIEAAISRRMKECEAAGIPLYIDDIKKFYNLTTQQNPDNVVELKQKADSEDGMASLMEEISEDAKAEDEVKASAEEAPSEETPPEEGQEGASAEGVSAETPPQSLNEAEGIIAEQKLQGIETKQPAILQRPYQRQAPDLEKVTYGFVLLTDINMEQMLTFTKDKFLQGQSVTIEFLIPQTFMMTADILYCHHYAMRSRIISSTKPDFRLQCRFAFAIPGERDTLRNFLMSIVPNLPPEKKKPKKEAEDDLGI